MKDFHHYFFIGALPADVWHALTNPVTLHLWTGEPAEMSTEPGTEFNLWGGSISGKNIHFEEEKKIVQEWYFGDQTESSVVTITLHPKGQHTSAELSHTNIPDEDYEEVCQGWKENYFGVLREFYRD